MNEHTQRTSRRHALRNPQRARACALFATAFAALACSASNGGNGSGDFGVSGQAGLPIGGGSATVLAGAGAAPSVASGASGTGVAGTSATSGRAGTSAIGGGGSAAPGGPAGAGGTGLGGTTGAAGSGMAGRGTGGGGAGGAAAGAGGGASGAGGGPAMIGKKFAGNITTSGQVRSDFAMYWDQITPENEGKWGSVEATKDVMNWSGLDRVHDYAKQHGIVFKQHNFVWGSQQPSWIGGLSASDQAAQVEEWIRLFCERYPDVQLIDVVNEPPPHTTPVYMNALGGAGASGYDWIVQAFKWAHQYCPGAVLILNDYNNIEYSADNANFIKIVNAIKSAGAPIDAIGCQAHDVYKQSTSTVQGFLDKLAATGLPIYITEFDIDIADDNQQQMVMQNAFTMFWNDADIKGVTLWGYVEGATWRTNTGLMSSSGQMRPAMTWLMGFLGR